MSAFARKRRIRDWAKSVAFGQTPVIQIPKLGLESMSSSSDAYDKPAANYLAFVQLASIRLWFSANESTSKSWP